MKRNLLVLVALAALPWTVQAEGDPEAGQEKAGPCVVCHGTDGKAQLDAYPHLAGQHEQYLVNALKAYKNNQRRGGQAAVMQGMAANLSEQDIEDLAAYYAAMEP